MKYFFKYLVIGIFLFYPLVSYAACPPDKPIQTLSGCMACDDPDALLQFKCITCDDEPNVDVLAVCPNRQRKGIVTILKECPLDKPYRTSEGDCYACSDEREFFVEKDYKNPCENRMIYHRGASYFSGIICPSDKPIYSFGKCYACSEEREFFVEKDYKNPCENRMIYHRGESYVSGIICPSDKPIYSFGECYACSDEREFFVEKDYKNPCPNRMIYHRGESYVSGIICPSDKPIYSFGECYACSDTRKFFVEKDYKNPCENRKIYQQSDGRYVSIMACPTDKPINGSVTCIACPSKSSIIRNLFIPEQCITECSGYLVEVDTGREVCSMCPKGQFWVDKMYLSPEGEVENVNGCVSCDDKRYVLLSEYSWPEIHDLNKLCPNRKVVKAFGTFGKTIGFLTFNRGKDYSGPGGFVASLKQMPRDIAGDAMEVMAPVIAGGTVASLIVLIPIVAIVEEAIELFE